MASVAAPAWIGFGTGVTALLNQMNSGNGCNNGLLSGLLGNGNKNCEQYETKESSVLREQVAMSTAKDFAREAGTQSFTESAAYTNRAVDGINTMLKEIYGVVIAQGNQITKLQSDAECNQKVLAKDMEIVDLKIDREAERRKCGDENLAAWTQNQLDKKANYSNYINGQDVIYPRRRNCSTDIDINVIVEAVVQALATGSTGA